MKYVAAKMHRSHMLLHNYYDILQAAEYAQKYLDDTLPTEVMEEIRAGMTEHTEAALQLIGADRRSKLPAVGDLRIHNYGDLRQAFSHVDPKFVWWVLMARSAPLWYVMAVGLTLFHRRSWQNVAGRLPNRHLRWNRHGQPHGRRLLYGLFGPAHVDP